MYKQNKPGANKGPKHTTPKKKKPIDLLGIATRQPVKKTPWSKGRDPQQGFPQISRNDRGGGNHTGGPVKTMKRPLKRMQLKKPPTRPSKKG